MPQEPAHPLQHPRDPLHGITLKEIVTVLVAKRGWDQMADAVPVRCFQLNPSIKSSLTFLRQTPWARARVEDLYLSLPLADRQIAQSN